LRLAVYWSRPSTWYTAAEYPNKLLWGHSTVDYAVDIALAGKARRLALFHHDPLRTDDAVDLLLEHGRRRAADAGSTLEVLAAAEGLVLDVRPSSRAEHVIGGEKPSAEGDVEVPRQAKVLLVEDEPDVRRPRGSRSPDLMTYAPTRNVGNVPPVPNVASPDGRLCRLNTSST
jgi:hypothetical protein